MMIDTEPALSEVTTSPATKTTEHLGELSLFATDIEPSLTTGDAPRPTSVYDIISSHPDLSPSAVAEALISTPTCYREIAGYLSGETPMPESCKEPLGWIKLGAWLDEQDKSPRFSIAELLCDPAGCATRLENNKPGLLLNNLPSVMDTLPEFDISELVQKLQDNGRWDIIANNLAVIVENLPELDVPELVQKLQDNGRWDIIANNLAVIVENLPELDVPELVQKLQDNGWWDAIADNLAVIVENLPEFDVPELVQKLQDNGRWGAIANNLAVIVENLPELDVPELVQKLQDNEWWGAIANNLAVIVENLPELDVPELVQKLQDNGWWDAIADNLAVIVENLPEFDVPELVQKLQDNGRWVAIANNLAVIVENLPEFDVPELVQKLQDNGRWGAIANNLAVIVENLPEFDVPELVQKLQDNGRWDIIANNLAVIVENLPEFDVPELVQKLQDNGRWDIIADNLAVIVENLPEFDVSELLSSLLATGLSLNNKITETFRPYVSDITEILQRHRLSKVITRSHDLQTSLEPIVTLDKALSGPDHQPFIPEDIAEFRNLNLSNYSHDCYEYLFKPLKNKTAESTTLLNQLHSLGVDTENIERAINQTMDLVAKSIASILAGEDSAEASGILQTTFGSKLALHVLRVRRGEWALTLSDEEIIGMMADPDITKSLRLPKAITAEVGLIDRSTRRPELAPTPEAIREANSLLRALHQAGTDINGQVAQIREALQAELASSLAQLENTARMKPDLAEKLGPQIQKITDKIASLHQISIDPDNPNNGLIQLAQFGTKNHEIIQAIRSALISSAMPSVAVPEDIRMLQNMPNIESDQLTPEQISNLAEFFNHHVIQEYWGKQGLARTSKGGGSSLATGTPSINGWERANQAREVSQQASSDSQPVKSIVNSSQFIRTVAGAMGDACYSQFGHEVPPSADVITMTNEDTTKILGNFLLLDSEYTDESNTTQKIKVLRAINPLDSTLKRYSAKSLMEMIIEVSKQLLPDGYRLAVIVEEDCNLATTNRQAILTVLHEMRKSKEIGQPLPGVSRSVNFKYDSTDKVCLVQ